MLFRKNDFFRDDYIRKKGYDGIKYKSSQRSSGCNYTLFCGPEKEDGPDYKTIEDKRLESFTQWLDFTAFKEVYINGVEYNVRESFWGKRNFTDADFAKVVDDTDPDEFSLIKT